MTKKYMEQIEIIKNDLNNEFERSRELAILNTKLEDILIYFEAYNNKLTK